MKKIKLLDYLEGCRIRDDFDIAIAAIAMSHSVPVITANLSHFKRIEELVCQHWIDS